MNIKKDILKITASIIGISTTLFCMIFFNTEIHEICPFATVCTGPISIQRNTVIFGIGISLGVIIIVVGYFIGRVFCGYLCPIGWIQKISDFIADKLKIKKIVVTNDISKYLYVLKYVITFRIIVASLVAGSMIFIEICPIYLFSSAPYLGVTIIALLTTILIFLISLKLKFFFCRFLCPYSVFIEIGEFIMKTVGFKKIIGVKREESACVGCTICDQRCPMENEISKLETGEHINCIVCMKCIKACPVNKKSKKTLSYRGSVK